MPNPALTPSREEYYVQTGSMFENPYGVPHEEIVAMLLELPAEMAAQVVFGKYVESSGLVFSGELVQMLFDRQGDYYDGSVMPRVTGDRWMHQATVERARSMPHEAKRTRFATGIDWARETDFTVITVLDLMARPARVVYWRRLNRVPWESLYREAGRALHIFGPNAICDATGMAGDIILDDLQERFYCPIHDRNGFCEHGVCLGRGGQRLEGCKPLDRPDSNKVELRAIDGFQFTKATKHGLIENLRTTMSHGYVPQVEEPFGLLRCPPIVQVEEEMSFYAWDDKGLDTDTVMSLGLAAHLGFNETVGESYVGSPYGS